MDQFDTTAAETVAAVQGAFMQLTALAVQYSFSVIGAIILLVVGYIVAGAAERGSYATMARVHGFDETLRRFFSKLLRYAILVLVGITVLAQFGVQTASVLAALGAIGLAIGLALQGTLQNIAAGVMLLVLRPFKVGEYIDTGDVAGTVQDIGLFATELRRYDGIYVLAPNGELWKSPITNFSRNATRLNDLTVGVGYGDDLKLARETLLGIAGDDPRVLRDPAPQAYVSDLGDSAVGITLRYWTHSPDWFSTKNDLMALSKRTLEERGLTIPFPQREIAVRRVRSA